MQPKSPSVLGDAMLYYTAHAFRPGAPDRVSLAVLATLCWALGAEQPPDCPLADELEKTLDLAAAGGRRLRKALSDTGL